MRNSDANKVMRSFTTVWNHGQNKWEIKEETWVPGYTIAHKATIKEALEFRIDMLNLDLNKIKHQIGALNLALVEVDDNKEKN